MTPHPPLNNRVHAHAGTGGVLVPEDGQGRRTPSVSSLRRRPAIFMLTCAQYW